MNKPAASSSRWTDGSMTRRVAKRYAAERRFKLFGLAAVGLSVAFLAFLLINMGARGLGGFTQSQIRLDVDFARSDLMLDPAALKGPMAEQNRRQRRARRRARDGRGRDLWRGRGRIVRRRLDPRARPAIDRRPDAADAARATVAALVVARPTSR